MNDTTVTLVGNLASDPELRMTGTGVPVVKLRVGCTARRYDKNANRWIDGETSWYTANAWRQLGEHALASLKRGDRVVLTGRLSIRRWENASKEGTEAEIVVDAIGHDLRFGTTRYSKGAAGVGEEEAPPADEAWTPSPEAGATPVTTWEAEPPADAPVAVGAETPF